MSSETQIPSFSQIAEEYRILAQAILKIKNTDVAEDPAVLAHLKDLELAMGEYRKQLTRLYEYAISKTGQNRGQRPPPQLYLVKR